MSDFIVAGPDWARLAKEWERSKLTQKEFCERRGISYTAFISWRSLIRKRDREAARLFPKRTDDSDGFFPITVEVESSSKLGGKKISPKGEPDLEVELPFGVILRFRGLAKR